MDEPLKTPESVAQGLGLTQLRRAVVECLAMDGSGSPVGQAMLSIAHLMERDAGLPKSMTKQDRAQLVAVEVTKEAQRRWLDITQQWPTPLVEVEMNLDGDPAGQTKITFDGSPVRAWVESRKRRTGRGRDIEVVVSCASLGRGSPEQARELAHALLAAADAAELEAAGRRKAMDGER